MLEKLPIPEGYCPQENDTDYLKIVSTKRESYDYKLTKADMLEQYFPYIGIVQPAIKILHQFGWCEHTLLQVCKRKRETNPHGKGRWNAYIVVAWSPTGKKLYTRVSECVYKATSRQGAVKQPFTIPFDFELNLSYSDAYKLSK